MNSYRRFWRKSAYNNQGGRTRVVLAPRRQRRAAMRALWKVIGQH